jgi:hypothetical protein
MATMAVEQGDAGKEADVATSLGLLRWNIGRHRILQRWKTA